MQPIFSHLSAPRKFLVLIFLFVVSFTVFSILSSLLLLPMLNVTSLDELNSLFLSGDPGVVRSMKMVQLVGSIGSFIVPAHVFAIVCQGNYKEYFGFDKAQQMQNIGFLFLLMLFAMPLINALAQLNEAMHLPAFLQGVEEWMRAGEDQNKKITELFLKMDNVGELLLNLLIVAIIPAVGEEMFFRGAVQKTFISWAKNAHIGVWVSAAVFSAFHFQFFGFFPRMLLGAMFGYLFIWSGSLWWPIAAHLTNNGLAVIAAYLVQREILPEEIETFGGHWEELVYILISVVGVFFFLKLLKKRSSFDQRSSL